MGLCGSKEPVVASEPASKVPEVVKGPAENGTKPEPVPDPVDGDKGFIPPVPTKDEARRLKLLRALNILDTDKEDRFSSITTLMCTVFNVPIAARQWFKAVEGLGDVCQTGRDISFCGHTILLETPQVMVIEDALEDVRFAGNPLVTGPPNIRFYAGAPLVSSANGYRYGSLCVIDDKPHKDFPPELFNMLAQFGELVVREIEKDKLALLQKMVTDQRSSLGLSGSASLNSARSSAATENGGEMPYGLSRAADCFVEGVMLLDIATPNWAVLYSNAAFSTTMGIPKDEATSQGFWDLFSCPGLGPEQLRPTAESNEPFSITVNLQSIYCQTPKSVTVDFRPAATTQLGDVGVPAGQPPPPQGYEYTQESGARFPNAKTPIYYFAMIQPESLRQAERNSTISSGSGDRLSPGNSLTPASAIPALTKAMPTAFTDVRLGPLIGRGAYGRVYRGSWNGNTVAVKVMEASEKIAPPTGVRAPSTDQDDHSERGGARGIFEAILSSSLSHPNVVHTYQYAVRPLSQRPLDMGPSRSKSSRTYSEVWIISEFCNRGPLLTAIERGAFLTQPSAQYGQPNLIAVLQTLQEIAAAMQYLHSHGIVHGDLTGGNVLLTASDKDGRGFTAKVVDFGLSRVCGEDGVLKTKTMGCAEYMPPELITGGILTKASDVYAFGVILWEMYVGRRAWEGLQPAAVLKKVASHEMLPFPNQTPHRLKLLGERCMSAEPSTRPTFVEVLSEVNAILGDTMNILQQFLHATASGGSGRH